MAKQVSFWGADDPEMVKKNAQLQRQQAIAAALQQGAQGQDNSSWNSMRVVPAMGWGQGATQLASAWMGRQAEKKASRTEGELETERQQRMSEALKQLEAPAVQGEPVNAQGVPAGRLAAANQAVRLGADKELVAKLLAEQLTRERPTELQRNIAAAGYEGDTKSNAYAEALLPKSAQPTDDMREYEAAKSQGYKGSLEDWIISGRKAGASSITLDTRQENEEDKAVGKAFGEQYVRIQNAGFESSGKIARYDRMEQLLDGVETGRLTPIGTDIAAYMKSFGFDVDPSLPNKEAARALSGEMALQARNPSGGAGMPGAMSDADRQFLTREITPNLGQTTEGRRLLIETNRKLAQRDQEVAALAREYRTKNGRLDEGFYQVLAEFSARNPLFGAEPSEPPSTQRLRANPDGSYTYSPP